MTREEAAVAVVDECFWGDYRIDPSGLLARLESGDDSFDLLILSKIVDQSDHPSRFIRALFDRERLGTLIDRLTVQPGSPRARQIDLVRANVLGEKIDIPDLSWNR